MRMAVINQPLGNRGDEAAHKAFIRTLSRTFPGSRIDIIFLHPDETLIDSIRVDAENVFYVNIPCLRWYRRFEQLGILLDTFAVSYMIPALRKFRTLLRTYDKVICAPGGICMGGFSNWEHIWQLDVARRLKVPVLYWGRSIGPFSNTSFLKRLFAKRSLRLLKYFSYTSLRDNVSLGIARQLGVKADGVVDSAFLECPCADVPGAIVNDMQGSDYAVFVPNSLTWHPRYSDIPQERIDRFYLEIIKLIEKKCAAKKIIMLPQTYGTAVKDWAYFVRLKDASRSKNIIVIDENQSSDVQQAIIRDAAFVIGARYHSVVFAINNQVPFISLSYEHKMRGLLEVLGMTDRMVEIQDIFDDGRNSKGAIHDTGILLETLQKPAADEARQIASQGFDRFKHSLSEGKCMQ